MGIIKATAGAVGGTLADQWLEYYICDSIAPEVLAQKVNKSVSDNSSNTKGDPNIVTNGSIVVVNEGQCAFVIEQGKVLGFYDKIGENVVGDSKSSGVFSGGGLKSIGKQAFGRIGFGGDAGIHQSVIYLDLKEKMNNEFSSTVHVNISDERTNINIVSTVSFSGVFSYRITNPLVFYKNICKNTSNTVYCTSVLPQLTEELQEVFSVAVNSVCRNGIMPHELNAYLNEIDEAVRLQMTQQWCELRGFCVVSVAINGLNVDKDDVDDLKRYERAAAVAGVPFSPGLIGVNFAGFENENKPEPPKEKKEENKTPPSLWCCSCGKMNTTKFCSNCGKQWNEK